MPEKTPPTYKWAVSLAAESSSYTVEAAYPVVEIDGTMTLKDSGHKIVFMAASGTGCNFTRLCLAEPGPVSVTGGFPVHCDCTYTGTWNSGVMAGRWARNVNGECDADHAEIDQSCVVTADSSARVQAEADKLYYSIGAVALAEIKKLRYPGAGDPVPA